MKTICRLFQLYRYTGLATLLCSSLLVSCGDPLTTAGIGGTGITSGELTSFGSVFVNGVEFNTDNSQFEVDGSIFTTQFEAMQAGLAVGMVIKIRGSIDDNGLTGTADSIEYDDQIQGPVEALPTEVTGSGGSQKLITIFGQEIIIDQASTSFIGTNFDTLAMNDLVEVSGFHAPNSSIHATFVEWQGTLPGSTQVELKGIISSFSSTSLTLSGTFSGITINIDPDTIIDVPGGVLSTGLFVEVEGIYQDSTTIDATNIEVEDNDFGNSIDHISLQGIVTQSNGIGIFTIGNQPVDASGANISPGNAVVEVGANVEVEGIIVGGILIADEVELRQGLEEFKAVINAIDPGEGEITLTFFDGPLTVTTDNQTRFEDDVLSNISLNDLKIDDFVIVKSIYNGNQVTATNIRRRDIDDTEIQGSVENFSDSSITILGISHSVVDGITSYEIAGFPTVASTFFAGLKKGDIVQITDNNIPIDGIADEVSK